MTSICPENSDPEADCLELCDASCDVLHHNITNFKSANAKLLRWHLGTIRQYISLRPQKITIGNCSCSNQCQKDISGNTDIGSTAINCEFQCDRTIDEDRNNISTADFFKWYDILWYGDGYRGF